VLALVSRQIVTNGPQLKIPAVDTFTVD
jgi:hypothetical protein